MKTANLSNDQLETALNATRMLLTIDGEQTFLSNTMFDNTIRIYRMLIKEADKRNLDI